MDRTYFVEIKNWKHCNKTIFKYVNSNVRLIFNEKIVEKWSLWAYEQYTDALVHEAPATHVKKKKKLKGKHGLRISVSKPTH